MNKKTSLLLFFWILIIQTSFAQQGTNTNLKHYKSQINQAELSICDGKYTKASRMYEKAFKTRQPFMRDIYNAWILESLHGKLKLAKDYFNLLLQKGIDRSELIHNVPKLKIIRDIPYWSQVIHQLDTTWSKSIFSDEYWALMKPDQVIRRKCGGYDDEVCNIAIREVDSVNLMRYIQLCQKFDYPNEFKYGKEFPHDGLICHVILLHNTMWGRHWADTLLIRKIELGVFDSRDFNHLQLDEIGALCYNIDGELFIPTYFKAQEREAMNTRRRLFYLEDLDSYFKKVEFSFKNSHFIFFNPGELPFIDYGKEKAAKADLMARMNGKFRVVKK